MTFLIEQSNEQLTSHAGLVFMGQLLGASGLSDRLNQTAIGASGTPDISNGDVALSYLGLLSQAQSDFDHIEVYREDKVFKKLMGITHVPSSPTLRQRLEVAPTQWNDVIQEHAIDLLHKRQVHVTPCWQDHVAVDLDVAPFDNSNSRKEGVSRTYKGVDGYAPMLGYLGGHEGFCLNVELREGKAHSQNGTPLFLRETIQRAKQVTRRPLMIRLDSGNDARDNVEVCWDEQCDFIIKRNLRREDPATYLDLVQQDPNHKKRSPRSGKIVYTGQVDHTKNPDQPLRMVCQVTVRTSDPNGQMLLEPTVETEAWWVSIKTDPDTVIDLYHQHATMEQFHSEFKTDLDLERLPSGKFEVNDLVLSLSMPAFNCLRLIGQASLQADDNPLRKTVKRRRIATVIKHLITVPCRLVNHARRWRLRLGCHAPFFQTFKRLYLTFEPS